MLGLSLPTRWVAIARKQSSLVFTSKSHMGMPVFTVSTVCGSDLMTRNSFNSWLLWEVFILPSVPRGSFAAYSNGCWQLFSSRTCRRPFHALLRTPVYVACLYMWPVTFLSQFPTAVYGGSLYHWRFTTPIHRHSLMVLSFWSSKSLP